MSYASAVRELFWRVENDAFIQRLGSLVLHFRGSFWLSAEHEFNTRLLLRSVGYQAWRNPRFFASLYLFGSNRGLLKRAWNACMPGGFEPVFIVMRGVSEHDYSGLVSDYTPVAEASILLPTGREVVGKCPRCGCVVSEAKSGYFCESLDCKFGLWRDNKFLAATVHRSVRHGDYKKYQYSYVGRLLDEPACHIFLHTQYFYCNICLQVSVQIHRKSVVGSDGEHSCKCRNDNGCH